VLFGYHFRKTRRGHHEKKQITAIIEHEEGEYASLCPELEIASQGGTIEDARENLREAPDKQPLKQVSLN